ncbi:MAG: alpha/beta hydrolase family protein [Acidimicrobiia bacterium]
MAVRRSGLWPAAAVLLVATVTAGCGGGGSDSGGERSAAEYAVGTRFETFVDESRGTEGREGVEAKPNRTLETFVYYPATGEPGGDPRPDAPAASVAGGFPLVVFSHGSGVTSPVRYDLLFRSWAAAGYVVVAPKYPLSSTSLPNSGADVVNQPADVSFVITEMLRRSGGLVDGSRIAAAGHSLGAVTTMGVAFNRCCVDSRIRAGIVLAGGKSAFPDDGWFAGMRTPILVVHGDDDRIVRIAAGREVFDAAPPPKAMLTVFGGDHGRPYGGGLATTDNPERLGATADGPTGLVNETVVAFLDRYLKDRPRALLDQRERLLDEVGVKLELVE